MHLDREESVAVSGNATRFYGLHCSNYENCKTLLFRLRREKCYQAEFTSSTFDVLLNLNQTYTLLADSSPKITRFQPYPRQIYVLNNSFHFQVIDDNSNEFPLRSSLDRIRRLLRDRIHRLLQMRTHNQWNNRRINNTQPLGPIDQQLRIHAPSELPGKHGAARTRMRETGLQQPLRF